MRDAIKNYSTVLHLRSVWDGLFFENVWNV